MTASKDDGYPSYSDIDFIEEPDPAVKIELDILNQSATDINQLEKEIDEARAKYQTTFLESSQQLEQYKKKIGTNIKQARPYYELQETAREAQIEALRSARKFQSSNGVYLAAKETISLAELRLMDDKAASLSAAWQEMLNHALLRVTEAEKEKSSSEQEHLKRAAVFAEIEKKLHVLEKKHKRSIAKARPYFEIKKELHVKLQQLKQSVEDLQQAFKAAKQRYSGALKRLEKISDSIHEQRRQKFVLMFPREPGVGAEDSKESPSEIECRFPTLSTSDDADFQDGTYDSDEDVYNRFEEDDEDDDGYSDINNESIFRARVLTTSLDDDDTSFMTLKHGGKRRVKKPLKRTQSLPLYHEHSNNSPETNSPQTSFGSDGCFMEKLIEKPLVPLCDRSESNAPDGDSLSNEKNIICDIFSFEPCDDINCGVRPAHPFMNFNTFMTKSSKEPFEPTNMENCKKMLDSTESSVEAVTNNIYDGIEKVIHRIPIDNTIDNTIYKSNETQITVETVNSELSETL